MNKILSIFLLILICSPSSGQKPRARDLGIPFVGTTGEFNAITDVKGVEVGYSAGGLSRREDMWMTKRTRRNKQSHDR